MARVAQNQASSRQQSLYKVTTVCAGITQIGTLTRQPGTITHIDKNAVTLQHTKKGSSKRLITHIVHQSVVASMTGGDRSDGKGSLTRTDIPVTIHDFIATDVTSTTLGFECTLEDGSTTFVSARGTTIVMEDVIDGKLKTTVHTPVDAQPKNSGRKAKVVEPEPVDETYDDDVEETYEEDIEEVKPKQKRGRKAKVVEPEPVDETYDDDVEETYEEDDDDEPSNW